MKKNFVLIAALIAALTVAFVSCVDDGVVTSTGGTVKADFYDKADGIVLPKQAASGTGDGAKPAFPGNKPEELDITGTEVVLSNYGKIGLPFPKGVQAGDKFVITYAARQFAPEAKFAICQNIDQGSNKGLYNPKSGGIYKNFELTKLGTVEVSYDDFDKASDYVILQVNSYENANAKVAVKIVSFELKE